MKIWIKNPLTIWTGNDLPSPSHGLLIEGSQIQSLLEEEPQSYDAVMDASGLVVLPGLINTHHHFYQTLTRSVIGSYQQTAISLAHLALSDLGAFDRG